MNCGYRSEYRRDGDVDWKFAEGLRDITLAGLRERGGDNGGIADRRYRYAHALTRSISTAGTAGTFQVEILVPRCRASKGGEEGGRGRYAA